MIRVARIGVTPLKGTRLAHPDAVELTPLGIPGNRRYHLVDERGRLFSCGDHGPLVRIAARYDAPGGVLALELPDGTTVTAGPGDLGSPHVTDFYGRPVPGRFVEGPASAAVSRYVGRPLRLVRADAEGDGPDEHRLSLLSLASVADLGARHGRGDLDPGRFRMNLELGGCAPYEEDGWAGTAVRIGTAVIRVLGQVPRCVATTRDPATGLKDFDTLKAIAAYRPPMTEPRGIPFGMYAEVEVPGRVALGDPVEPLATR
jgi:MOSC domain-containing protein